MASFFIYHLCLLLFCALIVYAAFQDIAHYKISNHIITALMVLFPIYLLSTPHEFNWAINILLGIGIFMIGIILFKAGVMGGGDVKLITVCMFWVGLEGLVPFAVAMGLTGGAMALFMISPLRHPTAHLCAQMGFDKAQNKILTDKLPYGVAICSGGLFAIYKILTGF